MNTIIILALIPCCSGDDATDHHHETPATNNQQHHNKQTFRVLRRLFSSLVAAGTLIDHTSILQQTKGALTVYLVTPPCTM